MCSSITFQSVYKNITLGWWGSGEGGGGLQLTLLAYFSSFSSVQGARMKIQTQFFSGSCLSELRRGTEVLWSTPGYDLLYWRLSHDNINCDVNRDVSWANDNINTLLLFYFITMNI